MQGNIIVITYWSYKDALVQTYTLPYVRLMKKYCSGKIYLVTLEQERLKLSAEEKTKIRSQLHAAGIHPIFLKYQPFGMSAAFGWSLKLIRLWLLILFGGIKTIHTWCTPAGMIGYLLSRFTGKKLILDSFEPHAEPMLETGEWKAGGKAFQTLFQYEKKQANRASVVIGLTESMKAYAKEKYGMQDKPFYLKPALIDFNSLPQFTNETRTDFRNKNQLRDKIVCVCAGKTGGLYFEKEVFDFFRSCADHWGERFHVVMLSPDREEKLLVLAKQSGFSEKQITIRFVPQHEVYAWMNAADFAFNPCRPVPSRRHGTSIKNAEYRAMGLPVVLAHDISDDSETIAAENAGAVLDEMNETNYRNAIQTIDDLLKTDCQLLNKRITDSMRKNRSMEIADRVYKEIYDKA